MFKEKVIKSFTKVREDLNLVKTSFSEWIVFLNGKNREYDARIAALENRINFLEKRELEKRW